MIGVVIAILGIVVLGARATDGVRTAQIESVLQRLPTAEAAAYYDGLRRRLRRIAVMRGVALLALLAIFYVFRQRLIGRPAPPPAVPAAVQPAAR